MTSKKHEYTGQLIGGPEDGNLVTSSVPILAYWCIHSIWLDGDKGRPSTTFVQGEYVWNKEQKHFEWTLIK